MKVSIALCTYNGESYLSEQLDSLIAQTRLPDEIVISDDGSSDATITILEKFIRSTKIDVKLFTRSKPLGVFRNFDFAIQACTGDLIFPCDQDDVWFNQKIEEHLNIHMKHNEYDLVYSNALVANEDLSEHRFALWPIHQIQKQEQGYHSFKNLVVKGRSIAGCCMSFKKTFYELIGSNPDSIYHDDWIATSACLVGRIFGISDAQMFYRQHNDNVVGIVRGSRLSFAKSLFTNAVFYNQSDQYIYQRHEKLYSSFLESKVFSHLSLSHILSDVLLLYQTKSRFVSQSWFYSLKQIINHLIEKRYHHHDGFIGFLYDAYTITFLKLKNAKNSNQSD